jgi:hypothetical protein
LDSKVRRCCNFHPSRCIFDPKDVPLDVISSCLIFGLSQPSLALQFWCVVGFCLGVGIFFRGLRLRRTRVHPSVLPTSISSRPNGDSFPQRTETIASNAIQEVIRLSPSPIPMKSADMTQQQKIAAALARTGSSTTWVQESTSIAVEATEPDLLENQTTPLPHPHSARLTPTPKSTNIGHLLIWCGLALAVLSCYLLVTFH